MLTVICVCWNLQRLAVDILTTLCCLKRSACGRRVRQRLLSKSKISTSGFVGRSLISSVSVANRATQLRAQLPPPPERQIHRRSCSNSDLLLSEKLDHVSTFTIPPSSEVGSAESAIDDAKTVAKRRLITRRGDDADNDEGDYGIERKQNDVTEIDRNTPRRVSETKGVGFPPVHTMLVVVTADMVSATAQIREGDHDGVIASATTTAQSGTSSNVDSHYVVASLAAESISDVPHSTSSTVTEDLSTTVAAAGQTYTGRES